MVYLTSFKFVSESSETDYLWGMGSMSYNSYYPFRILSSHDLKRIEFEPVTVLYGGNGSGKSTALNIIAEKIKASRDSMYNKTELYQDYVNMCRIPEDDVIPENSKIITSDDVFDYMLNIRSLNDGIDIKREDVFKEFLDAKYADFKLKSISDYDELRKINKSRSKTRTQFVKSELMSNIRSCSNGESAYMYFTEKIVENGLYILDEPENSLSPKRQLELKCFIEDYARFFNCQFIISTHSPFLLSLRGARIYDLDENPVAVRKWTELENVKIYHEFFKEHEGQF